MEAIDVKLGMTEVHSTGIAYYRLGDEMYEFLRKCAEKHEIVGFEYEGDRNFGVILGDKKAGEG